MKIDDGYGLADYENGNAFVNNRVVRHNVLVSAPVLKEAYDVGTAQPKHFVEHVLLVKDTVDFVNDAAELKNKILPLSTQPSSTKFLELTKRNANVQSQSNGGSKQTYKRGNFLDITKRKSGGTSSGGGSSSSGNSQSQQQSQNQTASNSEGTKNTEQMSVEALRSLEAIKETLEYFKNAEINRVLDIGGNGPCFPGGLGGALGL